MNSQPDQSSRRLFLNQLATTTGMAVLLPSLVGCAKSPDENSTVNNSASVNPLSVPLARPSGWNPIEFNLQRGLAGAIPSSYHPAITAADGPKSAIGKHLLYVAPIDRTLVPTGFIALMCGDFTKGYAKHGATTGHWYDWISITKEGSANVYKSTFQAWPTGNFLVYGGGGIEDAAGVNTIYLASLPPDVKPGSTIRVVGHCNLHGEYVDFITL